MVRKYKDKNDDHWYYICNVNIWGNQHHNSLPKGAKIHTLQESAPYNFLASLMNNDQPPWNSTDDLEIDNGYYFSEKLNIKPLLPYEGDYLLEGRFGQSLRFGSTVDNTLLKSTERNPWSYTFDSSSVGSPITIISNGLPQDPEIYKKKNSKWWHIKEDNDDINKSWIHTQEDINNDPSSIYLTSTQNSLPFALSLNLKSGNELSFTLLHLFV